MDAIDRMLEDLADLEELNTIRLVSGERQDDPGVTYFFYMDLSSRHLVSPYFHSRSNAEEWFLNNMG
jgi:hypothetical protein